MSQIFTFLLERGVQRVWHIQRIHPCATWRRVSSTGSLLFDVILMSTPCRLERCCATPCFFGAGDWHLDPKTEPVDHQTIRDGNYVH